MLADVAAGRIGAVVVWDLDRLHRQPIELEQFMTLADRHSLALATVTGDVDLSTDNGRLFARIKGAVARAEVERKSARQKAANRQRASMGKPPVGGFRAFGYTPDGMELVSDEAELIRAAYRDLLAGASVRGIAARWNAQGSLTPHGGRWRPDAVRRVLHNPRNAALRVYLSEQVAAGNWPPVVPEETYRAAVALLTDASRRTTDGNARKYLLPGLARCCVCGAPVVTGRTQRGKRTYRCGRTRGHLSRGAEPVDDFVTRLVVARLSAPDAADLLSTETVDVAALREESSALRVRLTELADLFADGAITAAQLARGTDRARTRLEVIEQEMAAAGGVSVLGDLITAEDVQAAWDRLDLDRRRAVVEALMAITLLPPGRGNRVFRPETVQIEWRTS